IRRTLEDLQALEITTCHKTGTGKADQWSLVPQWAAIFVALAGDACGFGTRGDVAGTVPREGGNSHDEAPLFYGRARIRDAGEEGGPESVMHPRGAAAASPRRGGAEERMEP